MPARPTRGIESDPYLAFNFLIEIDGLTVGGFTDVTGLQAEVEVEDYREGGVSGFIHKLSGPVRYPSNLVLKRGLMGVDELLSWQEEILQGQMTQRNLSVILRDEKNQETRRWNFAKAYPVRWRGPELRAGTNAVAVETLEFVHQGLMNA